MTNDFISATLELRSSHRHVPRLRETVDEFVMSCLALLFPHFGSGRSSSTREDIVQESEHVSSLLAGMVRDLTDTQAIESCVGDFVESFQSVREVLFTDAEAIAAGDPAASGIDEVILAYPGFLAVAVHRLSHVLYASALPIIPRLMSEWAHRKTGVDIHPGASIGSAFAIDHGTGIVIGETTSIGDRVRIYQGVTLGALAVHKRLANRKRHPSIGDDVVIYANATILGGDTEVGSGSIIGGNVWLTHSVPARSRVHFESKVDARPSDDGIEFHI